MSWTDVFPVLSPEMVELFLESVAESEKQQYEDWFSVEEVFNHQEECGHLVSTSLFWKREYLRNGEIPEVSRDSMMRAEELGLVGRWAPWETYVRPLLSNAEWLKERRVDVVIRVYLAKDLEFLLGDLVEAGCEVYLMRSSSISHNPGAMWRFLALEDSSCPVTVTDSDRLQWILSDIARTEATQRVGVCGWRSPYDFGSTKEGYRPIRAAQFGSTVSYPARQLMQAFVWHNVRGSIRTTCKLDGLRETEIAGTNWPDYGFDEWFLLAVMYPRMAQEGLLTFFPWDKESPGQFFALDIEYCTWAHPKSELIQYPNPEFALGDVIRPWAEWREETPLRIRSETLVIARERRRMGAFQGIFNYDNGDGMGGYARHNGDLMSLLAVAGSTVDERWFVDLNPQLHRSVNGVELFLDRRYDCCDLVCCGHYFIKITTQVACWAKCQALDEILWREGALLRVPKLEGPMTLWSTEFSRRFHEALISQVPFVKAEILLRAWMDQGKVTIEETTAKAMGWKVR